MLQNQMSATQAQAGRNDDGTIVPKHGHGRLRPIKPGEVRNPGGRGGPGRRRNAIAERRALRRQRNCTSFWAAMMSALR